MPPNENMKNKRAYSVAHFVLEVGKKEKVGLCKSVDGGNWAAEAHTHRTGGMLGPFTQVPAKAKLSDVTVQVGMATKTFYEMIEKTIAGKPERTDLAILATDFTFCERARRELSECFITSIKLPAMKADSKDSVYITATFAAEDKTDKEGDGAEIKATIEKLEDQKLYSASNFEFVMDDFTQSCSRIMSIEGIEFKTKPLEIQHGGMRHVTKVPGHIEWPSVTFTMPEPDAWPLIKAYEDRVRKGVPQANQRRTATLTLRDHTGGVLCTVAFAGVDILKIETDKNDAGGQEFRTAKITVTTEKENTKMTWA
jgi:hypothetical protein